MEGQPQNPKFRINQENFHPWICQHWGLLEAPKISCAGLYINESKNSAHHKPNPTTNVISKCQQTLIHRSKAGVG